MNQYLYKLLLKYFSVFISKEDKLLEIDPPNEFLLKKFPDSRFFLKNKKTFPASDSPCLKGTEEIQGFSPDYILLNGTVHYEPDIQSLLSEIRKNCTDQSRLVISYYSSLWRPFIKLADWLGLRKKTPEQNWISHEDMRNFLLLTDFEIVRRDSHILLPFWIPLVSTLANQFLSQIPLFNAFCLVNILVARPLPSRGISSSPSVSVVIAARNEEGHIDEIIQRIPKMGPDDEIIFIEGHSKDKTWDKIKEVSERYKNERKILIAKQDGKGKGDAVRKGFEMATREILMILDADMTVPPEDLTKFYNAIAQGKGEFINGSRLVYPMEKKAMQFCNLIANKFFALAFTYVLGQNFKDTLCGTKVLSRKNYLEIARHRKFFGEFDPFGDFDLIFGAVRLNLRAIEVPITYRERVYGTTNISRWRHGVLLFAMLFFAARKLKYV